MKILVLYYSRSGRTEKLARRLAEKLGADIERLKCNSYEGGFLPYLKAGYDSLQGNLTNVEQIEKDPQDYDLVLLGFPIWTSYPAIPMRSYLSKNPELPDKVGVFITYGGQSKPSIAVTQIVDFLHHPVVDSLAIRNRDDGNDKSKSAEAAFIETIRELGTARV